MREYLYNLATDKYCGLSASSAKLPLLLLSLVYEGIVRISAFFCRIRPYQARCKVISVGNITLGGTGKTSLVEFIARYLKEQGHKVVILSRGYKRSVVRIPSSLPRRQAGVVRYETMGDEPYMLFKKLENIPVIVDADRARSSRQAVEDYGADTEILDDGFQQWKIKKDLEVVTIDAADPFGNRRLLPRGILREPLSALKRADILVLTKVNLNPDTGKLKDFLKKLNPKAEIFESVHQAQGFFALNKPGELLGLDALRGKTVALFSGIASPSSFEGLIKSLGIKLGLSFKFPDHYAYTQEDLDKIAGDAQEAGIDLVITTEKDSIRIQNLQFTTYNLQLLVLSIKLELKNEARFRDRLLGIYSL